MFLIRLGTTECGLYCALSTLYDQLQQESCVDVYVMAKLYHLKRPAIFLSQVGCTNSTWEFKSWETIVIYKLNVESITCGQPGWSVLLFFIAGYVCVFIQSHC